MVLMSIESTDHVSEVQNEFSLKLADVFLHPVLVYGVFAEVKLLEVGELPTQEEVQTGLREFVARQHQGFNIFVGDEL